VYVRLIMLSMLWIIENRLWKVGYNDDGIQDDLIKSEVMNLVWFMDKNCDWFWYEFMTTLEMF
jgi:hypothetical protein